MLLHSKINFARMLNFVNMKHRDTKFSATLHTHKSSYIFRPESTNVGAKLIIRLKMQTQVIHQS